MNQFTYCGGLTLPYIHYELVKTICLATNLALPSFNQYWNTILPSKLSCPKTQLPIWKLHHWSFPGFLYLYLVGGLGPWNFMTFHILGKSSQLTNSYFSEGFKLATRYDDFMPILIQTRCLCLVSLHSRHDSGLVLKGAVVSTLRSPWFKESMIPMIITIGSIGSTSFDSILIFHDGFHSIMILRLKMQQHEATPYMRIPFHPVSCGFCCAPWAWRSQLCGPPHQCWGREASYPRWGIWMIFRLFRAWNHQSTQNQVTKIIYVLPREMWFTSLKICWVFNWCPLWFAAWDPLRPVSLTTWMCLRCTLTMVMLDI